MKIKQSFFALFAVVALSAAGLSLHAASSSSVDSTAAATARFPMLRFALNAAVQQLDLTTEQKASLKQIIQAHQPELKPLVDDMIAARQSLRAATLATPLSDSAVIAATTQLQAVQSKFILASAHLRSDLRVVLTPAQLEKIDQWQSMMEDRVAGARDAFQVWLANS